MARSDAPKVWPCRRVQKEHRDCTALQAALITNFISVTDSSTIETEPEGKYCVMAKARVHPRKVASFKRRLWKLRSEEGVTPRDVHVETVQP